MQTTDRYIPLQRKIGIAILTTFLIMAVAFGVVLVFLQKMHLQNAMGQAAQYLEMLVQREAEPLANELFEKRLRAVELRAAKILALEGLLSVTVYGADGAYIVHCDRAGRKAPQAAETKTIPVRTPKTVERVLEGVPALAYEAPVFAMGETIGFLRISYSMTKIERERRIFYFVTGLLLMMAFVLMLVVLNRMLSVTISRPITALKDAMKRVEAEGPGTIIPGVSCDEIGELIEAFNRMSQQLKATLNRVQMEVSERKQAEERLALSERQLRAILQASPVGIGKVNRGIFEWTNETLSQITGYGLEEFQGRDFLFLYENEAEYRRSEAIFHRDGAVETQWKHKNGEVREIALQLTRTSDDTYIFTAMDITERKNLEAQFLQSQKMEAIGTLAGGIAHDFNNILTSLMGYASLLQMRLDASSPLRAYVDQLTSASQKAADLIQSLLAFSRQQPVSLAPLDINNTIQTTNKLLKRLLTEDIELRISLSQDDTIIMADKSQMDQILFNLTTNARDAMPKGGTLTITTNSITMDGEFMRAHGFGRPGRFIQLTVSDTGTGIDEAIQEKIFDPFFTTKEVGKGTGLGLATVYGIVKQHNGYINVETALGQGTSFHIYLPVAKQTASPKKDANQSVARGHETILIAEDNEEARRFMNEALGQYGYTIIEAMDGEEAIDKFKEHGNIDLIIVDSVMPRKNGREVYEAISKIQPRIKALFTSGYTKDIVLDKGIASQEFDFIPKPLSLDKLLHKVREVLDR